MASLHTRYYQRMFLALVCIYATPTDSAKILLAPYLFASHVNQFLNTGKALEEAGHDIYVMLGQSYPKLDKIKAGTIKVVEYRTLRPDFYSMSEEETDNLLEALMDVSVVEDFRNFIDGFIELCTNPLEDEVFISEIEKHKFDLAIVDIFPGSICFLALMYRLDIPYVGLSTHPQHWLYRTPALPSFVPFSWSRPARTEKMNFWERLQNLLQQLDWFAVPQVAYMDDSFVAKYAPNKPLVSFNYLAGQSKLVFIGIDIVLDYPKPKMPNEIYVGGISTKPAKPLPTDLDNFMNGSSYGAIIMSFGSFSASLPSELVDKIMNAFRQVKQRVVWRFPHNPPDNVPPNVKLMDWLPQNDLLGHPKTRLFITHCGANGQFEALYHGIPMIGFPMFGEQPYNAKRMVYHGFGKEMDLRHFTVEELVENIETTITNKSYSSNIRKASAIFRSQPMRPTERLVFWINHVLTYGGDHLRSHALEMPWYEYLMLDIAAFLLLASITMVTLIFFMCRLIVQKVCGKSSPKLKKN